MGSDQKHLDRPDISTSWAASPQFNAHSNEHSGVLPPSAATQIMNCAAECSMHTACEILSCCPDVLQRDLTCCAGSACAARLQAEQHFPNAGFVLFVSSHVCSSAPCHVCMMLRGHLQRLHIDAHPAAALPHMRHLPTHSRRAVMRLGHCCLLCQL